MTFEENNSRHDCEDAEEIFAINAADRNEGGTMLKAILQPDDVQLESVPIFKRYAFYLISEYGYTKSCKILSLPRANLWRFLHESPHLLSGQCPDEKPYKESDLQKD